MFDDDDDDFAENKLNEDLEYFEAHLKGDSIGFMESDRLEALIDHYLLAGQYAKARSASEMANYHFYYNDLLEIQEYANRTILKGIDVWLDFIHSPNNKYQIKFKLLQKPRFKSNISFK